MSNVQNLQNLIVKHSIIFLSILHLCYFSYNIFIFIHTKCSNMHVCMWSLHEIKHYKLNVCYILLDFFHPWTTTKCLRQGEQPCVVTTCSLKRDAISRFILAHLCSPIPPLPASVMTSKYRLMFVFHKLSCTQRHRHEVCLCPLMAVTSTAGHGDRHNQMIIM